MTQKVKIILLVSVFVIALIVVLLFRFEDKKSEQVFNSIQEIAGITNEQNNSSNTGSTNNTGTTGTTGELDYGNQDGMLTQTTPQPGLSELSYTQLYNLNNDFMGWISIPKTTVNYPVMQSKDKPNYYLYKDFYQKYSSYGVPYIDERYDIDTSNNLLIYGHAMHNSTMFSDLKKYTSPDFYNNNSIIQYTDANGYAEYRIFSVFIVNVNDEFDYNNYINMDNSRFDEYIQKAIDKSEYNTNITPQYGDKLITLSTCDNDDDDLRFVVVGVKL